MSGNPRRHSDDAPGWPVATPLAPRRPQCPACDAVVSYGANGRIATQTCPGGLCVGFVYTPSGFLRELRDEGRGALYWRADSLDAAITCLVGARMLEHNDERSLNRCSRWACPAACSRLSSSVGPTGSASWHSMRWA